MPALVSTVLQWNRSLRWRCSGSVFIIVFALANALLFQRPLFSYAVAHLDYWSMNGLLTLATLFVLVAFTTTIALAALSLAFQPLPKVVCMGLVMINALALYFIDTYGVVLDKTMIGNVFNTDIDEASNLFHQGLVFHVALYGVVPCLVLSRIVIQKQRFVHRAAFLIIAITIGSTWIYANSKTWLWFDKNFGKIGSLILPWSYIVNGVRYQQELSLASRPQIPLPDAHSTTQEKTVVILVIGEAARAANFSLYGYRRQTNPLLAQAGAIPLPDVTSCATYTTASLKCILSHLGAGATTRDSFEPLPSYLQRNGVDVVWRSNNTGEPPLQIRQLQRARETRKQCREERCNYDEVLLHDLEDELVSSSHNKVLVVLHQTGSHGPSYFAKYPPQFEQFTPVCRSVELQNCSAAELANAYDNTVLYTDYFLDRVISMLRAVPNASTLMMYVSDHGESLGEYGLYLHGTPMAIAPDVQKKIPLIVWMSDLFMKQKGLTTNDLLLNKQHSHDNVFHSVMGAFAMESNIYDRRLDIFALPKAARTQ